MIQFSAQDTRMENGFGSEPSAIMHDLYIDNPLCTYSGLKSLIDVVADENIKAKKAVQNRGEYFGTNTLSRTELLELIDSSVEDFWIAIHQIERHSLVKKYFSEMVDTLQKFLPPFYGDIKYVTGTIFISRGKATTPFHMDYGSNMLLQLRGHKQFFAYSPNDLEMVSKQCLREFFTGQPIPDSLKYEPAFDERALVVDLEPGLGVYMPSTSPHSTQTTTEDLSVTMSLAFVSPLGERLRRTNLFDAKLPAWRFIPGTIKCGVVAGYEFMQSKRGNSHTWHKYFSPLPL